MVHIMTIYLLFMIFRVIYTLRHIAPLQLFTKPLHSNKDDGETASSVGASVGGGIWNVGDETASL